MTRPADFRVSVGIERIILLLIAVGAVLAGMPQVASAADECPNAEFRNGPSASLPECRAYEMVSPPDKGDGEVGTVLAFTPRWGHASESGSKFVYPANAPFGDADGFTVVDYNFAERGESGWSSHSISPPVATFAQFVGPYTPVRISRDFAHAIQFTNVDPATGTDLDDDSALYLYDIATDSYDLFATQEADPGLQMSQRAVIGADDFTPLYFEDTKQLTPDAPAAGTKVYRFMDGETTLASRLPDGTATTGVIYRLNNRQGLNRVSSDGSVLYFDAPSGGQKLYRRDDDGVTEITAPETADPVGIEGAEFLTSSEDGSRAFFETNRSLVDADDDGGQPDIYMYEESGDPDSDSNLTLITVDTEPDDGGYTSSDGLLGISEDGRSAYFVASGQLVEGEPQTAQRKLYLWSDESGGEGGLEYLDGLANADSDAWTNSFEQFDARRSQVSPNGRYVAVLTATPLTENDNGGLRQVYVYDRNAGEWSCASCRADGPSTAAARFRQAISFARLLQVPQRNVSNNGHAFFETDESLVTRDTNGKSDVYVWQDGDVQLLSDGRSRFGAVFADASVDGKNVFFVTRSRLTAADDDEQLDVYDASVGGGVPDPVVPPECVGDVCQGPGPEAPADVQPGSADYSGPGNGDGKSTAAACRATARQLQRAKRRHRKAERRLDAAKRRQQRVHRRAGGPKSRKAARRARVRVQRLRRQVKRRHRSVTHARRAELRCREGSR